MRYTNLTTAKTPICLAIYGCSSLEKVSDFINKNQSYTDAIGAHFTSGQLAGQYAFEQVKLDRKGYDTRRLQKYLSFLADSGALFSNDEALAHADELINQFTADFGHDEDGDATFRIKAQSFRLKKYDCQALWERVRQATVVLSNISRENLQEEFEEEQDTFNDGILDFRLSFKLYDPQQEEFATLFQYVTIDEGRILVEDFVDYDFSEYPNFHDESQTMQVLIEKIATSNRNECVSTVYRYVVEQGIKLSGNNTPLTSFSVETEPFWSYNTAQVAVKP